MMSEAKKLAQQLSKRAYGNLFNHNEREATVEAIWSAPGNPETLEALVNDRQASPEARFLASEVLFDRDFTFLSRTDMTALAEAYATALVNDYTGVANSWGLLYEFDDAGPVGSHLLMLDEAALPALIPLLDDETIPATYEGSETATVGNMAKFRVKDFAAFYISKIKNIPLQFHLEPSARDAEIEKLKGSL
jgi:hypothetical protein